MRDALINMEFNIMDKKEIALLAIEHLKKRFPEAKCSLEAAEPLHLLVATRLAAQCTDARVNMVTPALFKRFSNARDFADADIVELEEYIKSCGLYKTKARDLIAMGKKLVEDYNSQVPSTMKELLTLPGVGRKTANLILGDVFGEPSYVVDTHCIRITGRLSLHDVSLKDPNKIEKILRDLIPPQESGDFCHRLVLHGRDKCTARKPECGNCCMKEFCPKSGL